MSDMVSKVRQLEGWSSLDLEGEPIQELKAEQQAEAREIASLFYQCFTTDAGKVVLDRLITITIMRPTVKPHSTQFEAGISEGRADIVRQILQQLELAALQ